ncbi:hypothetical protein B9Q03_02775 [Candidatus Marsarchaeota G2 archaeon OSP_D]|uniref:Carbohydrate kinase FGGY N-terminal domain-containing protein n=2 Tax=Candidatus Marsarchaeota group 2 TaxID=2203771 RepID=A0A2R6BEB8_9ARCH|nr:MAG: hypothetical protein B9Q03_02775 [Candidatus Marsarchaeota G2 archaeon OSP_D]PSN96992.1 MAG: hypothetical protein B9Q09_01675 [Candidatus Marsarchaeota G2 archaeon ECH_B_SAG-C16]
MSARYGCIDVGTTSVKLAVYDEDLNVVHFEAVDTHVGEDGSHDPNQLLSCVRHLILKAKELGAKSVGLATYRASMVAWNSGGQPVSGVLTWLSPKSAHTYRRLPPHVRLLGRIPPLNLVISAYSPALRYLTLWEEIRERRGGVGDTMIWTLESFIVYALTHRYVGDATNAAMTGFVNPANFKPISTVTAFLGVKPELPEIVDNTAYIGDYQGVQIKALAADQQAACVGDACLAEGLVKITNGTGTFVDVVCEGYRRVGGLIPLVVAKHGGTVIRGVEGYLPTSGLAVDFLRRIGVVTHYSDLDAPLEGDVVFIPALVGLQLPSKPWVRGVISNLGLTSSRSALITALLKSIAFHVKMVVDRSGIPVKAVRANGKLSKSDGLLRLISACLGVPVERQTDVEATLRGLALLQMVGEGKMSFQELERTRRAVEIIRGDGLHISREEYDKWVSLLQSLKS